MKFLIKYLTVFILGIVVFTTLMSMARSPEMIIVGEWNEKVWEYENTDIENNAYRDLDNTKKWIAKQNLVIHKAETWKFLPNGKLILKNKNSSREINWHIKGRGNILELKYDNNVEHYNITELSDNKLVLNFDTDTHARGIAYLIFNKTK